MALKLNFREVTPEDTEILRMIALRNGKAEDYLCCDVTNEDGVTQTTAVSLKKGDFNTPPVFLFFEKKTAALISY